METCNCKHECSTIHSVGNSKAVSQTRKAILSLGCSCLLDAFGVTLLGTRADQVPWLSLHQAPINHVSSIQASKPDPLNPDPLIFLSINGHHK